MKYEVYMAQATFKYSLLIEGNDIDAKNAQRVKLGDSLLLKRMEDEFDTFEMVICTDSGKELDMLSYPESVGIAPFLDDGTLKIVDITVTNAMLALGKTRSRDKTHIGFTITFQYDETCLREFLGGSNVAGFMPTQDLFYALCLYRILDYDEEIVTRTHKNRYEFEVDLDEDTQPFFEVPFGKGNYFYQAAALFNEDFTQCKMSCKIYSDSEEYPLELSENDCDQFLLLINHYRIFEDEDPIKACEIVF
ncbi:MAG: hypothetical protein RR011_00770 [Oscillospiraceae bacterium]